MPKLLWEKSGRSSDAVLGDTTWGRLGFACSVLVCSHSCPRPFPKHQMWHAFLGLNCRSDKSHSSTWPCEKEQMNAVSLQNLSIHPSICIAEEFGPLCVTSWCCSRFCLAVCTQTAADGSFLLWHLISPFYFPSFLPPLDFIAFQQDSLMLKELINCLAALRLVCLSWCIKACRRKKLCTRNVTEYSFFFSWKYGVSWTAMRLTPFLMRAFHSVQGGWNLHTA